MITPLELAANIVVTVSILLAGRNSVHTWWTGIIGSFLFGALFYQAHLFADVALQLFFIVTSVLGWWQWLHGRGGTARPISQAGLPTLLKLIPVGFVVAALYGWMLHSFTQAYAPFLDSGILVFSVIAQVLMMRRNIECWYFWLLVNSIAVPLYASRDLYLTSGLYVFYWLNAVVAYFYWRKHYRARATSELNASLLTE